RVTIDLFGGGAWVGQSLPGFQNHDVSVSFNGHLLGSREDIRYNTTLVFTIPANSVGAKEQDNVLLIERTGGATGGYVQLDHLRLEADPDGLADADGDGMPRWFEETYGLDDGDPQDAGPDPDGDGLTNLEESQRGTNPTNPDSDGDGLSDGEETDTDPLDPDSDGDTLPDGAET